MMSLKKNCDQLMYRLVKTVLACRFDCAENGGALCTAASAVLKKSCILPEIPIARSRAVLRHRREDRQLAQIIEIIALTDKAIDAIMREKPGEDAPATSSG
jgi:hypothetical protein